MDEWNETTNQYNDYDYDNTSKYQHFSKFGSCLLYMRSSTNTCTYEPERDIMSIVFGTFLVLGFLNNALSVVVFIQPKYRKRLFSRLMRVYHIGNIAVVLLIALEYTVNYVIDLEENETTTIIKRICTATSMAAYKVPHGIMAYMAMLRYMNFKRPWFIAYSKRANTLSYLAIWSIVATHIGYHVKYVFFPVKLYDLPDVDDLLPFSVYFAVAVTFIIIFNVLWTRGEHRRPASMEISGMRRWSSNKRSHTVVRFVLISSGLYMVSTLPHIVFVLLPPLPIPLTIPLLPILGPTLSCRGCSNIIHIAHYLAILRHSFCFFDNIIYMCQSFNYRHDVIWGLKRLFTCRSLTRQKMSYASKSSDLSISRYDISTVPFK